MLEEQLGNDYTIVAPDLPAHGKTEWNHHDPLLPQDLGILMEELLNKFRCTSLSLLGYSIGARICLSLLCSHPHLINKLVLLAPDGIKSNPYYNLLTRTLPGRMVFSAGLSQPLFTRQIAHGLRAMRILPKGEHRATIQVLNSPKHTHMLRYSWPALRRLIPNPQQVHQAICEKQIPLTIITGEHDRLIPDKQVRKFLLNLPKANHVSIKQGHRLLIPQNASLIAQTLLC